MRSVRGVLVSDGLESTEQARVLVASGRLLLSEGKPREALVRLLRALRIQQNTLGDAHPDLAETFVEIARAYAAIDGAAAAEPLLRRTLAMQRATLPAGHPRLVPTLTALGQILMEIGAEEESFDRLLEAVEIARSGLPEQHSHRRLAEATLVRTCGDRPTRNQR
jgi:tetratricopeptide (TPR) repeat protein